MTDFSEWGDYHRRDGRSVSIPSRVFVFRRGTGIHDCEHDWIAVKPALQAWAKAEGVTLTTCGQCVFVMEDQADFDRKSLAFKLRWC